MAKARSDGGTALSTARTAASDFSQAAPGRRDGQGADSSVAVPAPPAAASSAEPLASAAATVVDEARLQELGLAVSSVDGVDAGPVWTIRGDTHPHRALFRELGGRWDGMKRVWVFTGADPRPALCGRLGEECYVGLAEAPAAPAALANRPHYWGHRQRLRERFLASGEDSLPDYELLELLLFFGIHRIDTKPLAKALLERFGGLGQTFNALPEQLGDFEDINHYVVTLFKAVRVAAQRLAREEISERPLLDNWDKLCKYLHTAMAHRQVEQFRLLFLDRRNVLIADEMQNQGSIDHTPVYPREVVKRALALDASALIMVHNHPSNHPQPSKPDIEMTRLVGEALERVGIVLHDHIIVSRRGETSFRQMGLMTVRR